MQPFRIALLAVAAVSIVACQSTPVTGRKQFLVVPESQAIEASKEAYVQTLQPLRQQGKVNNNAAPRLWEKMMQATGGGGKSDFLSTHPASEKRMEALTALIPQMLPFYEDKSPRPVYAFKTASN